MTEYKTFGDIRQLLMTMIDSDIPEFVDHANQLCLPRKGPGSTSGHSFTAITDGQPISDVTDQLEPHLKKPGCKYYELIDHDNIIQGKLGAIPLADALDTYDDIRVENGLHGIELVAYTKSDEPFPKTPLITIILCPNHFTTNTKHIIATWHPGDVMSSLDMGVRSTTAVKIKPISVHQHEEEECVNTATQPNSHETRTMKHS